MSLTVAFECNANAFMSDVDLWMVKMYGYKEDEREKIKQEFVESLLGLPCNKTSVAKQATKFFKLEPFQKTDYNNNYDFIKSESKLNGEEITITLGVDFSKLDYVYQ